MLSSLLFVVLYFAYNQVLKHGCNWEKEEGKTQAPKPKVAKKLNDWCNTKLDRFNCNRKRKCSEFWRNANATTTTTTMKRRRKEKSIKRRCYAIVACRNIRLSNFDVQIELFVCFFVFVFGRMAKKEKKELCVQSALCMLPADSLFFYFVSTVVVHHQTIESRQK